MGNISIWAAPSLQHGSYAMARVYADLESRSILDLPGIEYDWAINELPILKLR